MPTPFATRDAKLNASIAKAFGELFTFEAFKPDEDVNSRKVEDLIRAAFDCVGVWEAPARSKTPAARGSVADDNAHNWTASFPSVSIADDGSLPWLPRKGDKCTRQFDSTIYEVERSYPDSFGTITLQLTAKKRWVVAPPSFIPSLNFRDERNSQYFALVCPSRHPNIDLDFSKPSNSQYLALLGPGFASGQLKFFIPANSG